jgi:uncharacterized delta-60 repeat protein
MQPRGSRRRASDSGGRACQLRVGTLLVLTLTGSASPAWTAPGGLDVGFGNGGTVVTNFGWSSVYRSSGRAVLEQGDGRLVVGGSGWNGDFGFALVRYNQDGSLDTSFGDTGRALTVFGPSLFLFSDSGVYGLVQQSDGKLVAAGRAWNAAGGVDVALARYNGDGSLDRTFGADGKVKTPLDTLQFASALALLGDGRLVVAGDAVRGDGSDVWLARYNGDGSPDTSFGDGGRVFLDLGGYDRGYALAVQRDGNLVVAGSTGPGVPNHIALVRCNADGTLDAGFGTGGLVESLVGNGSSEAYGVLQQSDGRLVVAGYASNGNHADFAILRYDADGTPDAGFGTDGIVMTSVSSSDDYAYAVVEQPDGRLVVTGQVSAAVGRDFAIVRYNTDGSLDDQFANGGVAVTDVDGPQDEANTVMRQEDGKLVVGGTASGLMVLVRYENDGSLDDNFGAGGKVLTTASSSEDAIADVVVQSDGKLVAAGATQADSYADFALVRYEPDGSLDRSFGDGGKVITPVGSGSAGAVGIVQQASGRLVAGGTASVGATSEFALVGYDPDGSLDATFGIGGTVLTPVGPGNSYAGTLIQQRDGKLVLGGASTPTGSALVRYNPDGSLDPSFGSGGTATTPNMDLVYALAQQSDGKLVAAGSAVGFDRRLFFALARYNSDGTLDQTFGSGGEIFMVGSGDIDIFYAVLQQADSKIVAAGGDTLVRFTPAGFPDFAFSTGVVTGPIGHFALVQLSDGELVGGGVAGGLVTQFGLAAYAVDGSLDPGFGSASQVLTPIGATGSAVAALRLQPDTRLVAAGRSDSDFALARYFTQNCGNGTLDAGEQCDDGNTVDGDCCDHRCQFEPSGAPCRDGDACTDGDACDGAGTCVGGTPVDCDDGDLCTQDTCDPATGCQNDAAPRVACRTAGTSQLALRNYADDRRDRIVWKWLKGEEVGVRDLGDPIHTTTYTLCIYAPGEHVSLFLPAGSGWRPGGATGFSFKDGSGTPDGVSKAALRSGPAGRAKALVIAEGPNLPGVLVPSVPLPVTAQLVSDDGGLCLEAVYPSAARNDSRQFRARVP